MAAKRAGRPPGPRTPAEIAADKFRTGRPFKDIGERHRTRFSINLTDWEYEGITACAEAANMSLSGYMVALWQDSEDGKKWRISTGRTKQE